MQNKKARLNLKKIIPVMDDDDEPTPHVTKDDPTDKIYEAYDRIYFSGKFCNKKFEITFPNRLLRSQRPSKFECKQDKDYFQSNYNTLR